jgi:CubicO group peptidase (beta-lactamase class C family)
MTVNISRILNMKTTIVSLIILLTVFFIPSCNKNPVDSTGYQPKEFQDGWQVSTAEEQGLDPQKLKEVYQAADQLKNIYSLLVVKNGYLVGEKYFNGQYFLVANPIASVTKSYTSAFVGIALQKKILTSLDQKLMDFFPELDWQKMDARKSQITIKQMLQMRSGYPWEEFEGYLNRLFARGNWIPLIKEFPLTSAPGSRFGYSNLTAHLMGIIVARAANRSLADFATTYLFDPMAIKIAWWPTDSLGYHKGGGDLYLTPRDMAKFGQLYLDKGLFKGIQLIPANWVAVSLQPYSFNIYGREILSYIHQLDYGYFWLSATSGSYRYNFSWGHGGQMIVLLHDLNMVIVATAEPQAGFDDAAWQKEKAVMDLVGKFISSL